MEAKGNFLSVAFPSKGISLGLVWIGLCAPEFGVVIVGTTQIDSSREQGIPVGLASATSRIRNETGKVAMDIDAEGLAGSGQGKVECRSLSSFFGGVFANSNTTEELKS